MSNQFVGAQRVAVWTQPQGIGPAPFVAWGEALRQAFETPQDEMDMPEILDVEPEIDIEAIRAEAMAQGYAAGLDAGRKECAQENRAVAQLVAAIEALRPEPTVNLGTMIAATVERLLVEVMGEVEVMPETLATRAQAAAQLIGEETAASRLRLNPADLRRVAGLDLPLAAEADETLAPGEIRVETGLGWIEDSPVLRLERLRASLDRIAAAR